MHFPSFTVYDLGYYNLLPYLRLSTVYHKHKLKLLQPFVTLHYIASLKRLMIKAFSK